MIYVALLRGINVGGNNKVEMKRLKLLFEDLGYKNVSTYINSGNVIFETDELDLVTDVKTIEDKIVEVFGVKSPVVIRSKIQIQELCNKIPDTWLNNTEQKTDVMFLFQGSDYPEIIGELKHNPEVENLIYLPGSLVWNIDRKNYNQGQVPKFVGSKLYTQITARNINTVKKLLVLMGEG